MSDEPYEILSEEEEEEEEMASAPESGQPPGGRDDPWNGDSPDAAHPWPPDRHCPPKDEF